MTFRKLTFLGTCPESETPGGIHFSTYRTQEVLLDGEPLTYETIRIEISGNEPPVAVITMPVALEFESPVILKNAEMMTSERKVTVLHPDGARQVVSGLHWVKKGQRFELSPAGPDDEHVPEPVTFTATSDGFRHINEHGKEVGAIEAE